MTVRKQIHSLFISDGMTRNSHNYFTRYGERGEIKKARKQATAPKYFEIIEQTIFVSKNHYLCREIEIK